MGYVFDLNNQPKKKAAAAAVISWTRMNMGACVGFIPAKVSEKDRAMVTAGLAKLVDEVNQ